MDADSILSLMSLGASYGDVMVLPAEGTGADEALDKLVKILETDHDDGGRCLPPSSGDVATG
ncbi:phosphotransferase system HPr-like phosphotransfer protein [Arthrobacter sp. V4I6]|nr:phosphotransferase system HPr-like phosphotransfer protein [Arthrobacter sp. V1I7]MDQ0853727.1 phosphotransferase system HPr-like phosphotransfer protein [Arthrobacter sp. V4I6]